MTYHCTSWSPKIAGLRVDKKLLRMQGEDGQRSAVSQVSRALASFIYSANIYGGSVMYQALLRELEIE